MPSYKAPVQDALFLLNDVFKIERYGNLPGFEDMSIETRRGHPRRRRQALGGGASPLNLSGDREGCTRHADGRVTTPKGFKAAYDAYCAGGWNGLAADPEYGGQGLPYFLAITMNEFCASANMALTMYPGLTQGRDRRPSGSRLARARSAPGCRR